jgi:hypothetical protein
MQQHPEVHSVAGGCKPAVGPREDLERDLSRDRGNPHHSAARQEKLDSALKRLSESEGVHHRTAGPGDGPIFALNATERHDVDRDSVDEKSMSAAGTSRRQLGNQALACRHVAYRNRNVDVVRRPQRRPVALSGSVRRREQLPRRA